MDKTPSAGNEMSQALGVILVDGVPVTADDVKRLCREVQKWKVAFMNECFAHGHDQQLIKRLEHELMDCGELPTYRLTPKGYDCTRELGWE